MNVVPLTPDPEPLPTGFDALWLLIVKKCRKYETRQEWAKLSPDEQYQAIEGAAKWRRVWLTMEWQYIVDPCRWLKYRRFEDELPETVVSTQQASHVPFQPVQPTPKGTMSPEVRAAIAAILGRK